MQRIARIVTARRARHGGEAVSAPVEWQQRMPALAGPSTFVTVTAWIFIGLSVCSTLISTLQNVLLSVMLSPEHGFPIQEAQQHMSPVFAFVFGHIRFYFLAFLIVSASTLCASIGLLLRHEWARIAFIGILVLGILWNIGGIVLQQWLMSSMLDFQNVRAPPPELAATMQGMMIAIRVFSALFAIGVSVLFGWIIQKLRSPEIAAEFG